MGGSSDGFYKPSILEKVSYGFGDVALNFSYNLIGSYIAFYYIDVYIIGGDSTKSASIASYISLFSHFIDIFWCSFIGVFVDKHQFPFGKYRFYLLFGGIPLTIFSMLCFWDHFKPSILYACITYIGLQMSYTLISIPYSALNASITRNIKEITSITSIRIFLANVGGLFVYTFGPLVVGFFSGEGYPMHLFFFQLIGSLSVFIFLPLIPYFKKWFGKKGVFYVFGMISILGYALMYIFSRMGINSDSNGFMCIANFIKSTGVIMILGNMFILIVEVITYSEYTTGRRVAGIVNSLLIIFYKIGAGLGNALTGWILGATEYLAGEKEENTMSKDSQAWLLTTLIYSMIGFILLLICFAKTKERIVMNARETKNIKYSDLWTEFIRNPPLRIVGYYFICNYLCTFLHNSSVSYLYGMSKQSETTKEGIRWMVTILPIIISILMMVIISFYKLSDENIEEINREIEKRRRIEDNLNIS